MRIFSNFDTRLKHREYIKKKKQYWASHVKLLSKSRLYRSLFVDIPFFMWAISIVLLIILFHSWWWNNWLLYGVLPLAIISILFIGPRLIKHIIDYNMDFIIITPKTLYRYDQEWIISRDIVTVHTHSIKTVTVRKSWLFYSIFDNWDIVFLTEWEADTGEITLTYIKDPEKERSRIGEIIKWIMNNE